MSVEGLKKEYNRLLAIQYKGVAYLDDKSVPDSEKEKHISRFRKVIDSLNNILSELTAAGVEYTDNEVINGF